MVNLEGVLDREELVLVDSCCNGIEKRDLLGKNILFYEKTLDEEIAKADEYLKILYNPHLRTVEKVTGELSFLLSRLSQHYAYLLNTICNAVQGEKIPSRRMKEKYAGFIETVADCVKNSIAREVVIDDPRYKQLEGHIEYLVDAMGIKSDSDKKFDSRADEQILATAFWVSMYHEQKACIATKDNHFLQFFKVLAPLFGSIEFQGAEILRKSLNERPIEVYFGETDGEYKKRITTFGLNYPLNFKPEGVTVKNSVRMRYDTTVFWDSFAEIPSQAAYA